MERQAAIDLPLKSLRTQADRRVPNPLAEAGIPLIERFLGGSRRVIGLDNFERELLFRFERMRRQPAECAPAATDNIAPSNRPRCSSVFRTSRTPARNSDKLPRLLLIFLEPSNPSRIGSRKTTCCDSPSSFWKSRPIRMLKAGPSLRVPRRPLPLPNPSPA